MLHDILVSQTSWIRPGCTQVCVRVTSKHDLSVAAHPFPHTFSFDHVR